MNRNHDPEFNLTLGRIMQRRRIAEGLSRKGVLNLMNETRSTQILSCYEFGQKPVALPFIVRWCETMGVSLEHLLELVHQDLSRDPWSSRKT